MTDRIQQFVLLPARSLRARPVEVATTTFLRSLLPAAAPFPVAPVPVALPTEVRVLDAIAENGAKLVEMTAATARQLEVDHPGLRIAPVLFYKVARADRLEVRDAPVPISASTALSPNVVVQVEDRNTHAPIAGATVVAFTDFRNRQGASGESDGSGRVVLAFGVPNPRIERVYVYPPLAGYWGAFMENVSVADIRVLELDPVVPHARTALDVFVGRGAPSGAASAQAVRVGVVDTGVGPHPDLDAVRQGDVDNGDGHGTHVAGIVHAVAGGSVEIHSYRVFSRPGGLSANFSVAKAIDQAVTDLCDVINLSLAISATFDQPGIVVDPVVESAIQDAVDAGCLVVAANGNDGRSFVRFPARLTECVAVSAAGRRGTYPAGSLEAADALMTPVGTNPDDFVAAFSNVGRVDGPRGLRSDERYFDGSASGRWRRSAAARGEPERGEHAARCQPKRCDPLPGAPQHDLARVSDGPRGPGRTKVVAGESVRPPLGDGSVEMS
jgi:subtilisin